MAVFAVILAIAAIIAGVVAARDSVTGAGPDYGESVPALTDWRGRIMGGAELEGLRSLYALFGIVI